MTREDLINQRATTCRHGGHCEWVACDKCNHYEPDALSQQPCDDCISRQAIKRKLQEHHDFFIHAYGGFSNIPQNDKSRVDEITNCIAMVVNEPSVTPKEKTGWIPVSERLPEESKRYVVATKYNDVMTDFYTGEGFLGDGIIAWMPLPEPYKPQESEDKG